MMKTVRGVGKVDAEVTAIVETAAASRTHAEFRAEVLRRIDRLIGIDFGIFWSLPETEADATLKGFDRSFWIRYLRGHQRYAPELRPFAEASKRQQGVSLDRQVIPARQLDRLQFYQEIVRPVGSRSVLTATLEVGGHVGAVFQLGRGGRGCRLFAEEDAALIRRLVPAVAVGDAAVGVSRHARELSRVDEKVTEREREIIRYVRAGMTNREIALVCGISAHTVHQHLANVFARLGVTRRTELVGLLSK